MSGVDVAVGGGVLVDVEHQASTPARPGSGTLIVLRGLPGSGKTRWARAYVDARPAGTVMRLSRDDLRAMAFPTGYRVPTPEVEPVITYLERAAAAAVLAAGVDVVVDACNLRDAYLHSWAELAARVGARLVVRDEFLQVPVAECIAMTPSAPTRSARP